MSLLSTQSTKHNKKLFKRNVDIDFVSSSWKNKGNDEETERN